MPGRSSVHDLMHLHLSVGICLRSYTGHTGSMAPSLLKSSFAAMVAAKWKRNS